MIVSDSRRLPSTIHTGNWDSLNQGILDFLSIQYIAEKQLSEDQALGFTGIYKDSHNGKDFSVRYQNHALVANIFLEDWTRLIPQYDETYLLPKAGISLFTLITMPPERLDLYELKARM